MKKIYPNFLRFLALIIISLYVYFRFIKQRLPTSLFFYYFENNVLFFNYRLILLSIFLFSISSYMLIQIIRKLRKKKPKETFIIYLIYFKYIIDFIKATLISLFEFIYTFFLSYNNIRNFFMYSYNKLINREYYLIVFFLGFPYTIIPLALLLDTFKFFTLTLLYKTLFLFCLPLIYNMFMYVLTDLVSNLEPLNDEIDCIQISEDEIRLEVKDGFDEEMVEKIESIVIPEYTVLYNLNIFLQNIKVWEDIYKPWFLLFMYVIYLFCWTYILSFNIITLFVF